MVMYREDKLKKKGGENVNRSAATHPVEQERGNELRKTSHPK
jgi:hypothetical protein